MLTNSYLLSSDCFSDH